MELAETERSKREQQNARNAASQDGPTLQGLRPAEALAVAKEDVDVERRRLAVQRSLDSSGKVTLVKSRASHRTLDLADGSVATLSRRMAGSGPWIFPGKKPGRPYTYSGLVGAHDRVLERIGFGFDVYSFRHWNALSN